MSISKPGVFFVWSTQELYTTGPFIGLPTKVAPPAGLILEGYTPGEQLPAEFENTNEHHATRWLQYLKQGFFSSKLSGTWAEVTNTGNTGIHDNIFAQNPLTGTYYVQDITGTQEIVKFSPLTGQVLATQTLPSNAEIGWGACAAGQTGAIVGGGVFIFGNVSGDLVLWGSSDDDVTISTLDVFVLHETLAAAWPGGDMLCAYDEVNNTTINIWPDSTAVLSAAYFVADSATPSFSLASSLPSNINTVASGSDVRLVVGDGVAMIVYDTGTFPNREYEIWTSTDGGDNWSQTSGVPASPVGSNFIGTLGFINDYTGLGGAFVLMTHSSADDTLSGFFYSIDNGDTWVSVAVPSNSIPMDTSVILESFLLSTGFDSGRLSILDIQTGRNWYEMMTDHDGNLSTDGSRLLFSDQSANAALVSPQLSPGFTTFDGGFEPKP